MEVGATAVVTEEGETAIGLAVLLLQEMGAEEEPRQHGTAPHQSRIGGQRPRRMTLPAAGIRHPEFDTRGMGSLLPPLLAVV